MIKVLLILCLYTATAMAQFKAEAPSLSGERGRETDGLIASYAISNGRSTQSFDKEKFLGKAHEPSEPGKKSGFLAAGLSFLIPGLGEYYVGDAVWRGMIFTGLEIGMWAEYVHWNHRGDDSTSAFRAFSDAHFSQAKYASHLDSDLAVHNISDSCNCYVLSPGQYHVTPGGDFSALNQAEARLDSLAVYGNDPSVQNFTHRTPSYDVQQYYEIISKYLQYVAGWDDAVGQNFSDSKNMTRAADMRANMNYQYQVANYFLAGIIVNHVLSAIDAALLASSHNSQLHLQGGMILRPFPDGELGYVPTANIEYTF